MKEKKFKRTIEDFVCVHCGANVKGNGYTNHCPKCLWSKHVDINPGDRVGECKGLMEPVGFEKRADTYLILHRCVVCGVEKKNSFVDGDDFEKLLKLTGGSQV